MLSLTLNDRSNSTNQTKLHDPNDLNIVIKKQLTSSKLMKINPQSTVHCALSYRRATIPCVPKTLEIDRKVALNIDIDPRDIILTTRQTADMLSISPATFRGWLSRGMFPKKDGELNEKSPYWRMTTVIEYLRNAPGGRLGYPVG